MSKPEPSDRPRVALIAGPTASGKSALALKLAEAENGTIINADASQVYRDLRILTARPGAADEARCPHLLYGTRDAAEACSAADWAEDAKRAITAVVGEGRLPILVGGTGLYFRTLVDGIAPVPTIDADTRAAVRALSAEQAHAALAIEDPPAAARLHPHDTTRLQRALEVVRATGRPLAAWQATREGGIGEDFTIEVHRVDPPVAELYARCDARVAVMIETGALDEVERLATRGLDPALPAMRAIGVPPLLDHLSGRIGLDEAIATIRQQTRNYAKRQRTWFRNQPIGEM